LVRIRSFDFISNDIYWFIQPWGDYIRLHGGFFALADDFSNYNIPYLYLLVGSAYAPDYLGVPYLVVVKSLSVVFDGVLSWYVYRLVALRYADTRVPLLAGVIVFCLPTVVLNSSVWGQCDSIYTAFGVAGIYYLIRSRPWLGCLLLGLSLAFKLQAAFLLPVVLMLVLLGRVRMRCLLAIPAVVLGLDLPALAVGRPLGELLTVYLDQTKESSRVSAGAANMWSLAAGNPPDTQLFVAIGTAGTAIAFVILAYILVAARVRLTTPEIVLLTAMAVSLAPFLLPGMHERYFYLADIFAIVAAFYLPRRLWAFPILVQAASLLGYASYLFDATPYQPLPGVIMLAAVVLIGYVLFRDVIAPSSQLAGFGSGEPEDPADAGWDENWRPPGQRERDWSGGSVPAGNTAWSAPDGEP